MSEKKKRFKYYSADSEFVKKSINEKEIIDWSVKLQRKSKSRRIDELKKKGLL